MIALSPLFANIAGRAGPLSLHSARGGIRIRSHRKYTLTPSAGQLEWQDTFYVYSDIYSDPDLPWGARWDRFCGKFRDQLIAEGFRRPTGYNLWMQMTCQAENFTIAPKIWPYPPSSFIRQPRYTVTQATARASPLGHLAVDVELTKTPPYPANADKEIVGWFDSPSHSRDVFKPPRDFLHAGQQFMDDSPTQWCSWAAGPSGVWDLAGGDAFFFRLILLSRFDLVSTIGTYRIITIPW